MNKSDVNSKSNMLLVLVWLKYIVTWLPKKIWGGVRCCIDHGIKYTFMRGVRKIIGGEKNALEDEAGIGQIKRICDERLTGCSIGCNSDEIIDVVVPIYNGYDYLVKLFPTLLKTNMKCRYFLVDDNSPDTRVHVMEEEFITANDNAILIRNPQNYGFVKSVNNAMQQSENHIALVNTDTELPDLWLERLMMPILNDKEIASATPFSNSAVIFSFPVMSEDNDLYRNMTVNEIDDVFKMFKPVYETVPTGVGFCMGMNKDAIKDIGLFDYETFTRGYGEENDWCQRAIKAGFRNVQVENLFVHHRPKGLVASTEKEKMIEEDARIIRTRYPNYENEVAEYINSDLNREYRELAQMLLDMRVAETKSILAFDHTWGGGATAYLERETKMWNSIGNSVSIVRYNTKNDNYGFHYIGKYVSKEYEFDSFDELTDFTKRMKFDEIVINELVSYPRLEKVMNTIVRLKELHKAKLTMLFHDYYAICPTITLIDTDEKYCGLPNKKKCDCCFKKHGYDIAFKCVSIRVWQNLWRQLLTRCDEIRCFSKDTKNMVVGVFGDLESITVVPHKVEYMTEVTSNCKTTNTLNIGLMGILTVEKGSKVVEEMLEFIDNNPEYNYIRFVLIGSTNVERLSDYSNFQTTGVYSHEDVPKLVLENDIDIFFISSIIPETFSYTTEEVIKMGMPIACFNIGAPAERVKEYDKGYIITDINSTKALKEIIAFGGAMNRSKKETTY